MPITLLSPNGPAGLSDRPPLPAEILETAGPAIKGHTYHADAETGVSCVVWGATPYRIRPKRRPDYEFSLLLEGSVILTDGDGRDTVVSAGDAFVLPAAFTYQWGQTEPVLKYALSFKPGQAAAPGAVFTPFRRASLLAGDAEGADVLFEATGGHFRVVRQAFCGDDDTAELEAGQTLLTVIDGKVSITEPGSATVAVEAGETAFVDIRAACKIHAQRPARLIACTVRRP